MRLAVEKSDVGRWSRIQSSSLAVNANLRRTSIADRHYYVTGFELLSLELRLLAL